MNKLLVSRKFRTRIIEKISSSFPENVAIRLSVLAESYMAEGKQPDLSKEDQMISCVFNYIAQEIAIAIERSRKARERAASRKKQSDESKDSLPPIPEGMVCFGIMDEAKDPGFDPNKLKMRVKPEEYPNRQQRRRANRLLKKRMMVDQYGRILGQAKYCENFLDDDKEKIKIEIV
ncbi:MAG: hypothetical protein NC098_04050 [Lachnoclostridium sp.]|nr:hypothetical protein [Lachnoclostridium sp.]